MMFPNILRKDQEESDFQKIQRFRKALEEAEAVIIGAGAGLSTSAGFSYTGERFQRYFSDFAQKYGFHDMYSGGFYPYETLEEHWSYWSRYIYLNRYMDPPKPVYENLLELVKEKDYFVLTTNVDHCFQKAGFEKERLFIPRETTDCSSAQSPAARRPGIMRRSSVKWSGSRNRCGFPRNWCPAALIAESPLP